MAPHQTASEASLDPAELESFIVPGPLVSRGKPVFASSGPRGTGTELWRATVAADAPAWLALQVGVGPARVLLRWTSSSSTEGDDAAGVPRNYRIESSADSLDGRDGTWRLDLEVAGNTALTRAHDLEFDGQSWLRLTVLEAGDEAGAASEVNIEALDVFDASDGTDDCWLILGDELGMALRPRANEAGFAELVNAEYAGYFPALIHEARAGEGPRDTLARLAGLLALHPHVRQVVFFYAEVASASAEDRAVLDELAARVRAAGKIPIVAGEEYHAWLRAHPEQLDAHRRMTAEGRSAIQRLFAQAMDGFYVPQ